MRNLNEVREALLNSTVRIVAQYGLERTTTKLIAADAQINEAYIYRCYDSKDSLLQATFHMEDVCAWQSMCENRFRLCGYAD